MAVVPFRWLGITRLEQVRQALQAQVDQWSRAWAPAAKFASIVAPHATDAWSGLWYQARGTAGVVTAVLESSAAERLGCRLIGAGGPDNHGFAVGLGQQSLDDFFRKLVHATTGTRCLSDTEQSDQFLGPRHGVARYLWTSDDVRIVLFLDADLCNALSSVAAVPASSLVKRREAVLQEQVTLTAILDLGQAALEQTIHLKPGDVISTNVPLDAQVRLQASSSTGKIVSGELVARQGQRAFRFNS